MGSNPEGAASRPQPAPVPTGPYLAGVIYSGKSIFQAPTQLSTSLVLSPVHGTTRTKFPLFVLGPEQAALGFSAPKGQKMCTCTSPERRAARSSPASAPCTGCEAKQASKTQASALQESICLQARCPFFRLICKLWHSAGRVLCARYQESRELGRVAD